MMRYLQGTFNGCKIGMRAFGYTFSGVSVRTEWMTP